MQEAFLNSTDLSLFLTQNLAKLAVENHHSLHHQPFSFSPIFFSKIVLYLINQTREHEATFLVDPLFSFELWIHKEMI